MSLATLRRALLREASAMALSPPEVLTPRSVFSLQATPEYEACLSVQRNLSEHLRVGMPVKIANTSVWWDPGHRSGLPRAYGWGIIRTSITLGLFSVVYYDRCQGPVPAESVTPFSADFMMDVLRGAVRDP